MFWIDFSENCSEFSNKIFSISIEYVEKSIIKLSIYSNKKYALIVLRDDEVNFLGEKGGFSLFFIPLLYFTNK